MAKFEILNKTVNSNYEYTNDYLKVNGSYGKDATTGTVLSMSGQMHDIDDLHTVGYLRGDLQSGEMKYSLSGVKVEDGAKAWQAISDIATRVQAEDSAEQEAE